MCGRFARRLRDIKSTMATRKKRIDAFSHEGVPPADLPLEVLCEDRVGTYVIPFLCRWSDGGAGIAEASIFLANHSCAVRHNEEEE